MDSRTALTTLSVLRVSALFAAGLGSDEYHRVQHNTTCHTSGGAETTCGEGSKTIDTRRWFLLSNDRLIDGVSAKHTACVPRLTGSPHGV